MMVMLYHLFGELNINELEIPVVVLAEDLKSRRQVTFMEGDFYKVLAATIAMPIAFPPVRYRDMILIDGGTTNLVPVQPAFDYTDRIIVSTTFSNPDNDYKDFISIMSRALDLGKTRKGIEELKGIDNILIRCDVEECSFMDFQKATEIMQRGIDSTKKVLDEIKTAGFDKSSTWDDERIAQFKAKQEQITEHYNEILAEYKRTGMIEQNEFVGYLSGGLEMYS